MLHFRLVSVFLHPVHFALSSPLSLHQSLPQKDSNILALSPLQVITISDKLTSWAEPRSVFIGAYP